MEQEQLSADSLSGRQLAVAAVVAGLSPAAAAAGRVSWVWLAIWSAVGLLPAWLVLRRLSARPVYRGRGSAILAGLYGAWAVILAARVLSRAADRLELTSGGSPRLWLLVIIAIPLIWICRGKAAAFFRTAEILWLAMAVVLAAVFLLGGLRVEWRYVAMPAEDWRTAAVAAGELMTPALFLLPYIYKVAPISPGRGAGWLAGLGGIAGAMSLIAGGILGTAAQEVPLAFYVAAGLIGKSARCEGLLSALWLLPDLICAGVMCRVWGHGCRPAVAAALAAALAVTGLPELISPELCVIGILFLLGLTLLFSGGKGKIVVKN